ncbi:hypothetical protein [Ramlibacter sp.]|uniref:hypothetical protein n=1 Tax=Ramlibacter sp. TaxID=1917967 RepID=UPI003D0D493D
MQAAIQRLVELGPLPDAQSAKLASIQAFEQQLAQVQTPISDEEARALVSLFGPDDCFGLAWTMLHLIESAASWPIQDLLENSAGEWIARLRERAS